MKKEKTFLVINLSYFGDVLLTNALCQNIKLNFPNSKVVFMVNKPFYEAAKYMKDVDDVLCFDKKNKHKGLFGIFKFLFGCKYFNKIDCAFIMYANDRGILLSYLLNAKKRISGCGKITKHLLTESNIDTDGYEHTQDRNANFLKNITGQKIEPIAIAYNPPQEAINFADELMTQLNNPNKITGLCLVSKKLEKDMPIETAIELINNLRQQGHTVLYTGAGERAKEYAEQLKNLGCSDFVDLTNKTSISELGAIIQKCQKFISVDTGSLHLAIAVKTPLLALFYKNDDYHLKTWAPKTDLYDCNILTENITIESILENLNY